ncbi:hypothetical protein [Herbaspirillum robiniae]|uniref:hypothetical protein n=1 Tax=Herbaspirillum robiniae TaxID=2014887 RepID=UPI003D76DF0E
MSTKDPPQPQQHLDSDYAGHRNGAMSSVIAHAPEAVAHKRLTTEQAAAVLKMRPQSLLKRHSQTGAYFNVRPIKLPNGRLSWPADIFELLAKPHP